MAGRAAERPDLVVAGACYRSGDLAGAEAICREVLRRDRRSVDALQLLGLIAFRRGRFDEAVANYKHCLALRPREPRFHYLLGKVSTVQDRFDEALARFDAALAIDPGYIQATAWKAVVHERRGDDDGARALLESYVAARTEDADMAEAWARLELRAGRPQSALEVVDRHLARADLPPISREGLGFLAGRALEGTGDYDRAFEAFSAANRVQAAPFDGAAHVAGIDRIVAAFSAERLAATGRAACDASLVILVAGMPRSGTTLVEQIIDAHPDAAGAGEIADLTDLVADLPRRAGSSRPWPECVADLTQSTLDRLGREHLGRMRGLARGARRLVNKSLENYKLLGLAALVAPGARVVHVRRDPLDTCLSCFMSHLMPPRHAYAADLRHLGLVYRQYRRIMDHWRAVLDLPILDVVYEELVAEPEPVCRRLIEFCGLEWDDRCLRFHESGRFAGTLSYDQVRRPLYASAIGRYRNYERHLGPLKEALGP